MKNILVIYYSQSGQLKEILEQMLSPLVKSDDFTVDFHTIVPLEKHPFPWPKKAFFDVFPESFLQIPKPNEPFPNELFQKNYDLVILGYQTWYLSPSVPFNSFLKSEEGKNILTGKPVVTVSASRNMWIFAQEKTKKLLQAAKANLVGNIALVDRHWNHISVITIVHWMMGGKKTKYLGIFPKPGVSDNDIASSSKFGESLEKYLQENDLQNLQPNLVKKGAVKISPFLVQCDRRGNFIFAKWAKLIYEKGQQSPEKREQWLKFFNYYLIFAIWVIMPVVFVLFLLTYLPLYHQINKDKKYYQSVSLR